MNNHIRSFVKFNPVISFHASSAHGIILYRMLLLIFVLHTVPPPYAAAQPSEPTRVYPYGAQGSFNSSLTIIIVVLFSCFFIFGFLSFYIRQCINERSTPPIPDNDFWQSVHNRQRHRPRGLDSEIVDSLPVFPYSNVKHLTIGKGALECAVCISEFEKYDKLRLLLRCDHVFHQDCIDVWLASHTTCPVCRFDLAKQTLNSPQVTVDLVEPRGSGELSVHLTHEVENCGAFTSNDVETPNLQSLTCNINMDRPMLLKSQSMGHLLIQPGENCERYTLRLPEEVKKRIVKFNRAKSTCGVVRKCGGEGSSRPDKWSFLMTPSFLSRTISFGKGEGSTSCTTTIMSPV